MKSILLIGLGRFGGNIAEKLHEMNHDVIAVDKDEEKVEAVLPIVTNAMTADSTNPAFLKSLGIPTFDLCIVTIGDDFQSSLETTSLLKEFGARYVISRASRGIHEKFLHRNGADETVYPERQLALWTAMRYGSHHLLDYFELSDDYAVYEIPTPGDWIGATIGALDIRRKHRLNILGVKKCGKLCMDITAETLLEEGTTILVVGRQDAVQQLFKI